MCHIKSGGEKDLHCPSCALSNQNKQPRPSLRAGLPALPHGSLVTEGKEPVGAARKGITDPSVYSPHRVVPDHMTQSLPQG